jgi:cytosine/adenosine deaminase-related metal-dependent hydrolase
MTQDYTAPGTRAPRIASRSEQRESHKTLLRAAWIAPMDGPPIQEGGVLFSRGVILEVGPGEQLAARHPDAKVIDHPDCTVLPGLVNAHTHLELSEFACGNPPASFVEWIERLVPRGQATLQSIHESVARSIPIGVAQCLKFGVTCVGDVSRHCTVSRSLLSGGALRVVSYGEVQAMAQRRGLLEERIGIATDRTFASDRLRIGLSPHAPYSVELDGYRRCVEVARSGGMPLATHLAETPHEEAFLDNHSGPFRGLWQTLQAWDEDVPTFRGGPVRFAQAVGLLDSPTLLAHVNYSDDDELRLLAAGKASVVYCPRTHAYFGHPPHRWRDMLRMGINVAVGTDSCASSPDLNLVEELRLLHRVAPQVPADELWQMATTRAAHAIQMSDSLGSITAEKSADFTVFTTVGDDPLTHLLETSVLPREVWIGGVPATIWPRTG